jgi:glycosyltransferase involved in cell wall biosynthesis
LAQCEWPVDVLTIRPGSYLRGTPVDQELLTKVPSTVRVVRSGAIRGWSALGRALEPLKGRFRGDRRGQPGAPAGETAPAGRAAPPTPGLKTVIEELCAMPDKDVGWLLPAVVNGLWTFSGSRPDVIVSSAPPWTGHLVAHALASVWGRPWVADFRDPWVRSPWGRYSTPASARVGATLERMVVTRADAVLFTTETARAEFAAHYGPAMAHKFHTVPNGCDPDEFFAAAGPPARSPFVLLHAGSLYGGRSPVPLLRAVASLLDARPALRDRMRVKFLGATGVPGIDVQAVCQELGLSGVVEFVGRVSRRESLIEMQAASALLILQAGLTLAIPGKLYEYFASGRPVLALCEEGEMAQIVRESGAGVVASPDDVPVIAAALDTLMNTEPASWRPVEPRWYDGRLRAAETARILMTAASRAASQGQEHPAGVA